MHREIGRGVAGLHIEDQGFPKKCGHFEGKKVARLEYEAYEGMAEAEMERVAAALEERHSLLRVAIHHRVGVVGIGETSVVIAISSAHRADALAARLARKTRRPAGAEEGSHD